MKDLISEFKQFAVRGNAMQLAIAVVIGNSFSAIVNSLVGDIITPLLGLITGSTDFKQLFLTLRAEEISGSGTTTPALIVHYGSFIQSIFNFLIIALSIFIIFKLLSVARRRLFREETQKKVPEHEKPPEERLLEEIRDELRKQNH